LGRASRSAQTAGARAGRGAGLRRRRPARALQRLDSCNGGDPAGCLGAHQRGDPQREQRVTQREQRVRRRRRARRRRLCRQWRGRFRQSLIRRHAGLHRGSRRAGPAAIPGRRRRCPAGHARRLLIQP